MKKALSVFGFFLLFFGLLGITGVVRLDYLAHNFSLPSLIQSIGFLFYPAIILSVILTQIFTRGQHPEFENTKNIFNRFAGKFLLANYVLIIIIEMFWLLFIVFEKEVHYLFVSFGLIQDGALFIIILAPVASYLIAHWFYRGYFNSENPVQFAMAILNRFMVVYAIIMLLCFVPAWGFAYQERRDFINDIKYDYGDLVNLQGHMWCINGGSTQIRSCTQDVFDSQEYDYNNVTLRYNYELIYRGVHWTTNAGNFEKGLLISGVFQRNVDVEHRIAGTIELTRAESIDGTDLLAISELVHPEDRPNYGFDTYYFADHKSGPRKIAQPYIPPENRLGPNSSIFKTYNADGSMNIQIYDANNELSEEQERQIRQDAMAEFYKTNTPSSETAITNPPPQNNTPSLVPTTQEILQIFIDNPDFSFSAEEQQKRSAYQAANPGASTFGYFSPQRTTPDPNVKKIMYWPGKINQHWDIAAQKWISDPDGVSGADISESQYCFKWYGEGAGIGGHAKETISTWREVGKTEMFTATRVSMQCM